MVGTKPPTIGGIFDRAARPMTDRSSVIVELYSARSITMPPVYLWRGSQLFKAKQGVTLPLANDFAATSGSGAQSSFMHVSEQMDRKSSCWVNLRVCLSGIRVEPVRSLMRHEDACVMVFRPTRQVSAARLMQLSGIED